MNSRARVLLLFFSCLVWPLTSYSQSAGFNLVVDKETTPIPVAFAPKTFAVWSGGALVILEDRFTSNPQIHVVDREGKEISRFLLTMPHGGGFDIADWGIARGHNGLIAVVGTVDFPDKAGTFLAIVNPGGADQKFVRLSNYLPRSVVVAEDATIWVVGSHMEQNVPVDREQDLIRRYDASGNLLTSFTTWDSMQTTGHNDPAGGSVLLAGKDRVGWYSKHAHTYMEFSLDGAVITRLNSWNSSVPQPINWPVLCEDGSVFVSEQAQSEHQIHWGIFALDRQSKNWDFTPRNELTILYGCEGTNLVSTTDLGRSITWLKPTAN